MTDNWEMDEASEPLPVCENIEEAKKHDVEAYDALMREIELQEDYPDLPDGVVTCYRCGRRYWSEDDCDCEETVDPEEQRRLEIEAYKFNCPEHGAYYDPDGEGCRRCWAEYEAEELEQIREVEAAKILGHLLVVKRENGSTRVVVEQPEISQVELSEYSVYQHVANLCWLRIGTAAKNGLQVIFDDRGVQPMIHGFIVPVLYKRERIEQSIRSRLQLAGEKKISIAW